MLREIYFALFGINLVYEHVKKDNRFEHPRAYAEDRQERLSFVRCMPLCVCLLVVLLPAVTQGQRGALYDTSMGYVNVKDYGARGNGATDDTRAIEAASRHATATHGTVLIPAGKYIVSSPILFDGCNILGAGVGASIIHMGYNRIVSGMGAFYTPGTAGRFSAQTPEEAAKDTRRPGLNTFHIRQIGDTANAYFSVIDPTVTKSMFSIDLGAASHVIVGPYP